MTVKQIKDNKRSGDMVKIANKLNTTPDVVRQALARPNSKRHMSVVSAFTTLLNERDALTGKQMNNNNH